MKKILTAALLLSSASVFATPAQLSLPGNNLPASNNVEGIRLTLLNGQTNNVKGLNLNIGLSETQNLTGLDLSLFLGGSKVTNEFKGVSLNVVNLHEGQDTALNFGLVNVVNRVKGANIGLVNYGQDIDGLNLGGVNYSIKKSFVDVGFVNFAPATTFQIGFVNVTERLEGIQIGLVNFASNGVLPVMPLVNFNKSF